MDLFNLAAKITLQTGEFEKGLEASRTQITIFGDKLRGGLATAAKVGAAAIGAASAATIAFAKSSVDVGQGFDKSMAQVAATMGKTVSEIQDLRNFALEMGSKTAFSASQAADALNFMALAGYDAEQSMSALPNVLNLAAAGGIELARASDMVTDAQSALGLSMEESAALVDKMAQASSKSNTSVAQLGDAILTVGGTAKNLAGGTTELSTALGLLADNGIKGAEGGTALRNLILSLSAPTDTAAQKMAELGLEAYDASGNLRPMQDIFSDLNSVLSDMTQGEQTEVLNTLFNKVDLKSANALLATSTERWEELAGAIDNASGAAAQMAETQLDNLNGDITLMKSALEGAQIVISDRLTPKLREFVQFGTDGITRITDAFKSGGLAGSMDELGNVLSEGISRLADGLPSLLNAGSNLVTSLVTGVTKSLPKLAKAGADAIKTLAKNAAKTAPELIKTATDAVIGIADTLTHPDTMGQMLDAGVELVLSLGRGLVDAIPRLATAVPKIVSNIVQSLTKSDSISKIVNGGVELLSGLIQAIPQAVREIASNIPQIITGIATALAQGIPAIIDGGVELFSSLLDAIPQTVVEIVAAMPQIIGAIVTGLAEGAASIFSAIDGLISGSTERIKVANEKIAEHVAEVKTFADALSNTSPQLADYNRLLSNQGNTIADLDEKTRATENAITEILSAALAEQRGLREEDLQSVQNYIDELNRLAAEKLQIYRSQQIAELTKLQLESGAITQETAAQYIANAAEALDRTNQITEEAYTARLTTIQQKYQAMGEVGSAAYKAELEAAKAAHDEQLAENQTYYQQTTNLIETSANAWVQVDAKKWAKLNGALEKWKSDSETAISGNMKAWENGLSNIDKVKDGYLTILSTMDLQTANGFLNMVATVKASGDKIDEDTRETAANILGAFDNLPEELDAAGKNALLGLIYGMESKIPGLEDTSDMTANEIVNTIKAALGIASPSKVMKGIGENTIQGLVDGMREKAGSVTAQASNIVSSLVKTVSSYISEFSPIGSNMAAGLWSGFAAQESGLMYKVRSSMQRIVAAARAELQIASPSKVFAKIGAFSAEGLGVGWDREIDSVTRDIAADLDFSVITAKGPMLSGGFASDGTGGHSAGPVTYNIVVNGAEGQSVTELVDELERRLVWRYRAREAAYA